ncbi:MAG: L,D-transpeptidase [Armatimonadota bacterium]
MQCEFYCLRPQCRAHRGWWSMVTLTLLAALIATVCSGIAQADIAPTALETPFQPEPPDVGLIQPVTAPPTHEAFFVRITSPADDGEVLEGSRAHIRWDSGGPIEKVRLYYSYDRCKLAGKSRGSVGHVLFNQMIPNFGEVPWTVPWMDGDGFRLRIAAYGHEDELIASDEIGVRFRPAELKDLPDHAIGIVKKRQRLYYYEDGRIRRMHIVSTAAPGYWTPTMKPGSHDPRRGAMGKVFGKQWNAWSRQYQTAMPFWLQITASGSHGIHATSPPYYQYLGRPASHGCVRQHRADAQVLYGMVDVGTPVYIF